MYSNQLTISIADLPVTLLLDSLDAAIHTKILERYADFIIPSRHSEYLVSIRSEPGEDFIPFGDFETWQVRTGIRGNCIDFESHLEKGWVDRGTHRGELVVRPKGDLENFLRVLYAWICIEHDSLVLHSCGVIRNNQGYAFFGPSGNGKTTTARLSSEYAILSDDLIIIKRSGDKFIICGTPFRGDLPEAPRTNKSADLAGMFALAQDTRQYLAPLALYQAVARLVQCVPFVMSQPQTALRVTEICTELAAHVPVRMMHFQRDVNFWEMID